MKIEPAEPTTHDTHESDYARKLRREAVNNALAHAAGLIETDVSKSKASELFAEEVAEKMKYVEQLGDETHSRQLNMLISFGKKHRLNNLSSDELIELTSQSPELEMYIEKLRSIANSAIDQTVFNTDSSLIVDYIGRAGDMCRDKELQKRLAAELKDIHDLSISAMREALEAASRDDSDETYKQAFRPSRQTNSNNDTQARSAYLDKYIEDLNTSQPPVIGGQGVDVAHLYSDTTLETHREEHPQSPFSQDDMQELKHLLEDVDTSTISKRLRKIFQLSASSQ